LRNHQERQAEERELAGNRRADLWQFAFCSTIGTPLDGSNPGKHFKARLAAAQLADRR